jgi:restriction system protein
MRVLLLKPIMASYRYQSTHHHNHGVFALVLLLGAALEAHHLSPSAIIRATLTVLIGLLLILIGIVAAFKRRQQAMADTSRMNGLQFERYVAWVLVKRGYTHVQLTQKYDFGVDIKAYQNGVWWGIQVKHYSKRYVNQAAVQAVVAGLSHYSCDRPMVITSSFFTRRARVLATSTGCVLIDQTQLRKWIARS